MDTQRIAFLLRQHLDGALTPEQQQELDQVLQHEDHATHLQDVMDSLIGKEEGLNDYRRADWDPLFQKVRMRTIASRPVITLMQKRLIAAAAIVALSVAVWLLIDRHDKGTPMVTAPVTAPPKNDLLPGSNKATLTLADNTTIDLDDAKEGVLGAQGNSRLIKRRDGSLSYETAGSPEHTPALSYNLLTTPRGGQYQLTLPDGSKVWLNADSRLKYPTAFNGRERVVELSGEAYFEIAPLPSMPFKVSVMDQQGHIDVLGTSFNVKAYADEPVIQTTLLQGSVKVQQGNAAALLRPGQQARWNSTTSIKVASADVEQAVAWKNGLFKFDEASIEEVMRQLARWYDVDIVYVNGIPKDLFRGEIYRSANVSKVLKVLEASGAHFSVEGRKIIVKN